MATMLEELDAILAAPSETLVPGGLPPLPNQAPASMTEELEAILAPPAPVVQPNLPGVGSGVNAIAMWLKANPQAALDFILQGGGTALGIAGGAMTGPAAPIAAPAGGAAGNVAGKQLSRRIGGALNFPDAEAPPDLDSMETAIDAGLGALGPAANTVARVGGRAITGLRKGPFDSANRVIDQSVSAQRQRVASSQTLDDVAQRVRTGQSNRERMISEVETDAREGVLKNVMDAAEKAVRLSNETRTRVRGGMGAAAAGSMLTSFEPVTGALIGAGLSELVLTRAVPQLLKSPTLGPKFARWALGVGKQTKAEAAASLAAIAGQNLSSEERFARDSILSELGGTRNEAASFDDSVGRYRSPNGRFSRADEILRESERDAADEDDDK